MPTESLIYRTDGYIFASPRYHAFPAIETTKIPDNYANYDSTNQTYDKYFPCYALNTSDEPQLQLIQQDGKVSKLEGDIQLTHLTYKLKGRKIGKKSTPSLFSNSTLEEKQVFYSEYATPKLHPGWSTIQLVPNTSKPTYLVRALGNNTSLENYFALQVDQETSPITDYPVGTIIKYSKKYWLCLSSTKVLPKDAASFWQQINFPTNVFNADVYAMTESKIKYVKQVTSKRRFNPLQPDTTLVNWNVSYYSV